MGALLASLTAAILVGAADFFGGRATINTRVVQVGLVGQGLGFVVAYLFVLLGSVPFSREVFTSGIYAGVCGSIALAALYKGLAVGRVAVVASLSALIGALIPVVVSVISGHTLSFLTWFAVALGLVAVYLLSLPVGEAKSGSLSSGLKYGIITGVALGGFYLSLGNPMNDGNMWVLCGERTAIVSIYTVSLLVSRVFDRMDGTALKLALAAGAFDVAGNILFVWSAARGPLHMVALLSSLYPISTIFLGSIILKERLNQRIAIGIGCALSSIAIFAYQ